MTATLVTDKLTRRFGNEIAANRISLSVEAGEFIAVIGPSGSGKSTLLRLIAGLETPDHGTVSLAGTDITRLPPHRRDCSLVFQNYALFPHRTVRQNIEFGLRMHGFDRKDATRRIDTVLDRVGLGNHAGKRPDQLSGGQQQRVALARALAVEPSVLLLDEPFGALDLSLRRQLQNELSTIQREDGRTVIHVTHDQAEALTLADRLVVLHEGSVAQIGTPQEIYERPANAFVAGFMDFRNVQPVTVLESSSGKMSIDLAGHRLAVPGGSSQATIAAVRPEHVAIDAEPSAGTWSATVIDVAYGGSTHVHRLDLGHGVELEAQAPIAFTPGSVVGVTIDPGRIVLLEA